MGQFLLIDDPDLQQVMVTGFIFKVKGRVFKANGETTRLHVWAAPEDQDTDMTLGIATGLSRDVELWYDAVNGYGEEDDD